ncbi:hypothetical protein ASD00_31355 [Ensifer sp. Root31]|uniref:hypothetical protein n=1 Tax=Ensifer sp. Root31 TaxID=1736512 RepID=UPI000710C4FE|nr:hypothetical protein [Ensifer sp. Root31]KQU86387.1 hypothetical protein ASD00_31355 [Ensifer sp. Root31]
MRLLHKEEIRSLFDLDRATKLIEEGFVASSAGRVALPPVQYFRFSEVDGDCCVKSAHIDGGDLMVVKISTGFYRNVKFGRPNNNGLMVLISARTGEPLCILDDRGWLTSMRTAIAGQIAARLLAPDHITAIGLIGAGEQSLLQLELLLPYTGCRIVWVLARIGVDLQPFVARVQALGCTLNITYEARAVAEACNMIVTATPSRAPLLFRDWIQPGTHITAIGADSPGKQELDPAILSEADYVVVDSIKQCTAYGELSHLGPRPTGPAVLELGEVLASGKRLRSPTTDISVADLTGIAAQDLAIARSIMLGELQAG